MRSIAISSDGRHLAVGPNSKALRIFDTQLDSEGYVSAACSGNLCISFQFHLLDGRKPGPRSITAHI